MKRTFKIALLLCLISLASVLTLTACDITDIFAKDPQESISETTTSDETAPEETPQHIWSEWIVIKEAKCEENGLFQRYCTECNYTESKPIDALGHTEVIVQAVAPTCTQNGWTEGKYCSTCNEVFVAREIVNALGHTEVIDSAVAPTCTATGLTQGKHCSVCNEVFVAQTTIDVLGHGYTSTVTPPTATENGNALYTCSNCSDTYTEVIVPTDFTITADNRAMVGYTEADGENLVIPAVFQYNGTWYRVTTIGDYAFEDCDNLTSVTIGDSVTTIGDSAFSDCYKLVEVINKSSLTITAGSSDNGCVAYYAKEVHNGTTKIVNQNDYLFYTYNGVNYLIRYVGTDTALILPENYNGQNYEINQYAFYRCSNLTSITIPDSVTTIGIFAFSNCSNLTSVTIGNSVTTIGRAAFSDCYNLTSVTIGNSVTTIGRAAFSECYNLTSVTIGNSVTTVGDYAFFWCFDLTSVTIGNSVTTIGDWVFDGCDSLTRITFEGTVAQWNAISKGDDWKYYVPATSVICSDGTVTLN